MQQSSFLNEENEQEEEMIFVPEVTTKVKKEPTTTQVMIAERFVLARRLSGLKENDAIIKMGLKNPKVISQIENLHRLPTLHFVIRAANAYGVSTDYLLGLSEDDDRSSDIATRSAILRQNQKMIDVFAQVLSKTTYDYAKNVGDNTTRQLVDMTEMLYQKFSRFCELNPSFLDMRGGAPVQQIMLSLMPVVRRSKKRLDERDKLLDLHNQQIEDIVQRKLFEVAE